MKSPKLTDVHLGRRAVIYVRQSTQNQVAGNLESQRRQYGLVELAEEMGFSSVEVIDDDQGRSGAGTVERPGFDRLFSELATREVGAVFCLEASRLARNGREWHMLLDMCASNNRVPPIPGSSGVGGICCVKRQKFGLRTIGCHPFPQYWSFLLDFDSPRGDSRFRRDNRRLL